MSHVTLLQAFKQAVEEANEIFARREGLQPATSHEPLDFLNPPEGASLEVKEQEKGWLINAPEPPSKDLMATMSAQKIICELQKLACNPEAGIKKVPLFRILLSGRIGLVRRRRGHS